MCIVCEIMEVMVNGGVSEDVQAKVLAKVEDLAKCAIGVNEAAKRMYQASNSFKLTDAEETNFIHFEEILPPPVEISALAPGIVEFLQAVFGAERVAVVRMDEKFGVIPPDVTKH